MEQNNMENIDIEKHKELFAYEMTEVALRLKGEFAMVSGKDTQYWKDRVDDQALKIAPVSLPGTKLEPVSLTVPTIPAAPAIVFPKGENARQAVLIPEIGRFGPVQPAAVELEAVQVSVPRVSVPEITMHIPQDDPQERRTVSAPQVRSFGGFHPVQPAAVELEAVQVSVPRVSVPEITMHIPQDDPQERRTVSVLQVQPFGGFHPVQMPKLSTPVDFQEVPASFVYNAPSALPPVEMDDSAFKSSAIGTYTPPVINELQKQFDVPDTKGFGAYVPPSPVDTNIRVLVPDVKVFENYGAPKISSDRREIRVPDTAMKTAYVPPVLDAVTSEISIPAVQNLDDLSLPERSVSIAPVAFPEIPAVTGFSAEAYVERIRMLMIPELPDVLPDFRFEVVSAPAFTDLPEVPVTELDVLLGRLSDASMFRAEIAENANGCARRLWKQFEIGNRIMDSIKEQNICLTEGISFDDALTQAMQIDTSYISAEEFFDGFQFE